MHTRPTASVTIFCAFMSGVPHELHMYIKEMENKNDGAGGKWKKKTGKGREKKK